MFGFGDHAVASGAVEAHGFFDEDVFAGAESFYGEGFVEGSGEAEVDGVDIGIEEDFGEAAEGPEVGEVHLRLCRLHVARDRGEVAFELLVVP